MPSIYDFIGMPDPMADVLPVRRQYGPAYPSIPPEVEDSLLSQLAGGGLSALGYVGSTLDKPGAAVRGLLAGQPDQLLNLIPFSDTLGITDESDRVSGRDLLEQYGMLGPNTPGLDLGDVAGFAAEVGLDPLTYMTFGASALTKAGRAADAAGTLAKATYGAGGELLQGARAAQMAAGQRALVGFGVPFMGEVGVAGTGPLAQKIAGTLDTVGDYARFGNPVGLALGGVLDSTVKGATTRAGQIQARRITELERAAEAAARSDVFDIMQPVRAGGGLTNSPEEVAAFRMAETGAPLPQGYEQFQPQADALVNLGKARYESEIGMGMDTPFLQDQYATDYLARQKAQFPNESVASYNARAMEAKHGFQKGRDPVYKDIPGATETINKMSLDPFLSGPEAANQTNQLVRAKYIRDNYLEFDDAKLYEANNTLAALRKEFAKAKDEAARLPLKKAIEKQAFETAKLAYTFKKSFGLADSLGGLDPQHLKQNVPLFPNHPIFDALEREVAGRKAEARAQGLYEFLGANAREAPQPGDMPLMDVVKQAGLGTQTIERLSPAGLDAARSKALLEQALGTNLEDDVLEYLNDIESAADYVRVDEASKGVMTQLAKHLGNKNPLHAYVPAEVKDEAIRLITGFSSPEPAGKIIGALDKFTNAFKVSALAKPSRIVRDLYSGQFANWVAGLFSPRSLAGTRSILKDGLNATIDGIENAPLFKGKNLTPQQATQEVIKLAFANKVVQPFGGEFADLSTASISGSKLLGEIPGGVPNTWQKSLVEPWKQPGAWNPFRTRGVGLPGQVANETQFAFAKVFENLASSSDGYNRLAPFIEGIMQGMDPAVAARKVKAVQVDYSALTATERSVLKRVLPFYCVPDDSEIMTRDGWKTCDQLVVGEEVLTYNLQDDCMEWQPCSDKAIFDHDQDIEVIQNKFQKIRCTSEHRWVAQYNRHYPARILPYEQINNGNWIRVTAPLRKGGESLLTTKQARLLGWLLTDGYSRARGNHIESVLYQHPKKFLFEVEEVAGNKATWFHPDTGTAMLSVESKRKKELVAIVGKDVLLKTANILPIIARLNHEAARAMYDAMYKACGTVSEKRTNDSFASERKNLKEAMQFLSYLLGYRCAECKRGVSISHKRNIKLEQKYRKKEHYTGRVWCPQTPNGTWLMRQGKFVGITGNTFTKKMAPQVFKELIEKPGGKLAQTIRAENMSRDDQFLPPYLAPGLAVRLPESLSSGTGEARYLTSIDLPHESVFQLFRPSNTALGTLEETGMGLMGMLNPLIKGPAELATGKQFYSGRDLQDLDSRIGRVINPDNPPKLSILLDQALMNLPITSPLLTTVGTLADPRKGAAAKAINTLSGVRVSDVDVDRSRDRIARDAIEEMMRNHPALRQSVNFYVPQELQNTLSPEEQLMMGELNQIRQRARDRAQQRNAGAGRL